MTGAHLASINSGRFGPHDSTCSVQDAAWAHCNLTGDSKGPRDRRSCFSASVHMAYIHCFSAYGIHPLFQCFSAYGIHPLFQCFSAYGIHPLFQCIWHTALRRQDRCCHRCVSVSVSSNDNLTGLLQPVLLSVVVLVFQ